MIGGKNGGNGKKENYCHWGLITDLKRTKLLMYRCICVM